MKIKEWLPEERPREKLIQKGAESLTDAELLALLLGSGIQGKNCVDWAKSYLAESGGMHSFFNLGKEQMLNLAGLGPARAARIMAVKEIATRFAKARVSSKKILKDPESLAEYLRLSLGNQKREMFRVFFLNKRLEILAEEDLFAGTIDETAVYPRDIVEKALLCHATGLILAHNHPSGRLKPSTEDIRVTGRIADACFLVGIKIIDHVIVGPEGYFSFRSEGILPVK